MDVLRVDVFIPLNCEPKGTAFCTDLGTKLGTSLGSLFGARTKFCIGTEEKDFH